MDIEEVFSQIVRYFPEGDDGNAYQNMLEYACANLSAGNFAEAQKYSDIIINGNAESPQVISALYIKMFIKLRCRNEEEFSHCDKFNTQMPEYMALLQTCSVDRAQLKKLSDLTENNSRTVAADIAAARAKEEAAMRERQAALRAEAERKRLQSAQLHEEQRLKRLAGDAIISADKTKGRARGAMSEKRLQMTIALSVLTLVGVFLNIGGYFLPVPWWVWLIMFVVFSAILIGIWLFGGKNYGLVMWDRILLLSTLSLWFVITFVDSSMFEVSILPYAIQGLFIAVISGIVTYISHDEAKRNEPLFYWAVVLDVCGGLFAIIGLFSFAFCG